MIKRLGLFLIVFIMASASFMFTACVQRNPDGNGSEEEIDMSKYPFFVDDAGQTDYTFDEEQTVTPYWLGNIIYNESIMPVDNGTAITAKLQYAPLNIISVRDYTLKHEYEEGTDYTVEGNVLTVVRESSVPRLTEENLRGVNVPEPYRKVDSITKVATDFVMMGPNVIYTESSLIYGHQLFVTYAYDIKDLPKDVLPEYIGDKLPRFTGKLNAKEPAHAVIIGSSTGEGCSSSGFFNREPFMDNFITLSIDGLNRYYGSEVTLKNLSKGGTTVAWGQNSTQISAIVAEQPDVLFIVFGTNECAGGMSANMYQDHMLSLILQVRDAVPDCEFVIFNMFTPNPVAYDTQRLSSYWTKNNAIADTTSGVEAIDLYTLSTDMLRTKKYMDVTGNGINHINDYSSRLYAMAVMSAFVDYVG